MIVHLLLAFGFMTVFGWHYFLDVLLATFFTDGPVNCVKMKQVAIPAHLCFLPVLITYNKRLGRNYPGNIASRAVESTFTNIIATTLSKITMKGIHTLVLRLPEWDALFTK